MRNQMADLLAFEVSWTGEDLTAHLIYAETEQDAITLYERQTGWEPDTIRRLPEVDGLHIQEVAHIEWREDICRQAGFHFDGDLWCQDCDQYTKPAEGDCADCESCAECNGCVCKQTGEGEKENG